MQASCTSCCLSDKKNAEIEAVANTIKSVIECELDIRLQAKKDISEYGIEEFVTKRIAHSFLLVKSYKEMFTKLHAKTKKEFESVLASTFSSEKVRDLYEELQESESAWDELLTDVDMSLEYSAIPLKPELEAANIRVVIVSFGTKKGANMWMKETGCPFDIYVDQKREIYHAFGLYRSVSKVWSIGCLIYYAEQLAAGRDLPHPFEDVKDDPIQMGGDFILNADGVVVMTYPSKASNDRPTIQHLLKSVAI